MWSRKLFIMERIVIFKKKHSQLIIYHFFWLYISSIYLLLSSRSNRRFISIYFGWKIAFHLVTLKFACSRPKIRGAYNFAICNINFCSLSHENVTCKAIDWMVESKSIILVHPFLFASISFYIHFFLQPSLFATVFFYNRKMRYATLGFARSRENHVEELWVVGRALLELSLCRLH